MNREKILIVDDSEMNRSILADMLADEFDTDEAENGAEAVRILSKRVEEYSLILLDIVMPELDGFGVLEAMNANGWIESLPVIMISAETKSSQIERAYNLGATDFIMRPFDASIVHRRVVNTVLLYVKQKKLLNIIDEQVYEKEQNSNLMVDILSHIVEFRNGESGLHIRNVRTLTELLLRALCNKSDKYNFSDSEIAVISMAAALHDIGKISIDEHILNKPGKLTDEEYAIMKTHSAIGARMLEDIQGYDSNPLVKHAYEICRWHHERYDGRGYPDGLKGDEIPVSAQIVALADVYDALVSNRVYKPPFSHEEAINMITNGKCGVFNPDLLECLKENAEDVRNAVSGTSIDKRDRDGIRNIASAIVHSRSGGASARTLRLLDYERMKYNFYAAMTKEIHFEYFAESDSVVLSSYGAKKLGLKENFKLSKNMESLNALLGKGWYEKLAAECKKLTPDDPQIKRDCKLKINGETKWFTVIIRTLWSDGTPPGIEGALGKMVDMTESHEKMGELMEKALHDPLTGLWNRAASAEQIEKRIRNFPKHKYALAIFDIDFFKQANDKHGHLFGDRVLKEVSERLLHSTRAYDICARIGGDEFLVFLEYDTDLLPIITRIFRSLEIKIDNFDLSVSLGVTEMSSEEETYEKLFHKADLALYYSKKAGRAQFHVYDDSMEDVLTESDISEIRDYKTEEKD